MSRDNREIPPSERGKQLQCFCCGTKSFCQKREGGGETYPQGWTFSDVNYRSIELCNECREADWAFLKALREMKGVY